MTRPRSQKVMCILALPRIVPDPPISFRSFQSASLYGNTELKLRLVCLVLWPTYDVPPICGGVDFDSIKLGIWYNTKVGGD